MARAATARPIRSRAGARSARKKTLERCEHGLLRGTCAICLQMEETIDLLQSGRLAPEERPGMKAEEGASEEEEEEEEGDKGEKE